MATYLELYDLRTNVALLQRVSAALTVKAAAIIALATPTAKQLQWALDSIEAPPDASYLNYLLGANSGMTLAALTGAADATIQSAVNAAVDKFTA